jgi:signal transduction histidine kinase/CheY-like chemotaxis protein/HPt (histidine-containing phosphotransfer) domain-containing protein
MIKPAIPLNETERLLQLLSYKILDTESEQEYDNLTQLAASIAGTPIALISLIDTDRQWFKSCYGFGNIEQTDRDIAFCAHAIHQPDILIIEDMLLDERFKNHPLVINDPKIRFYAGVPLIDSNGFALGTICTIDMNPKILNETQIQQLKMLGTQVIKLLELRKANIIIQNDYLEITELTKKTIAQQKELESALVVANSANEAKKSFVANLSHEIRTPINGISGIITLLDDSNPSPDQSEYLNLIKKSLSSLLYIVNDLLDFSKISSGSFDIEVIEMNLNEELNHIAKTIGHGVKKKNIDFTVENNINLKHYVKGDPHRLKQILLNLGNNSIKFTENGEIKLSFNLIEKKDSVVLQARISDSGIGISEKHLTKLFTPFTQADASTTRKYGGTGLGLSIVKQLTELMGGTVSAKSTLGQGTEFYLEIPFISTDVIIHKNKKTNNIFSINKPNNGVKVLMAEDNDVNQKIQKTILEKMGYNVDVASTGFEVLEKLQKYSYHIVLMDMQMPEMDGIACTKKIRSIESLINLPIIALTANTIKGDKERCLNSGMNNFISKPFNAKTLNDMIIELVGNDNIIDDGFEKSFLDKVKGRDPDAHMDDEDVWGYLETFSKSASNMSEKIINAYFKKDLETIRNQIHSLRSSSLYVGEEELSAICEKIEDLSLFSHFTKELKNSINKIDNIINNKELRKVS